MNIIEASKARGRVRPKRRNSDSFRYWAEWIDKAYLTVLGDLMDVEWEEERKVEVTEQQVRDALHMARMARHSGSETISDALVRQLGLKD